MTAIVQFLFGASWKTSLVGLASGLILAAVSYAQSRSEPGWYLIAIGLAALGRWSKDWDKSNAPSPSPEAQSVKPPTT